MKENFKLLHENAVKTAQKYLTAESDLIDILQRIDGCKGYRELGHRNLFDYSIRELKLSSSVAFNLITVARKAREIPQLQDMIRNREITLSNARKIVPILTRKNQEKWLSAAASLSKRELEKQIAKENPMLAVPERVTYVAEGRLEFKIGISERLHEELRRAQDLLSSQLKKAATLEDTLKAMAEFYLEKVDPIQKAERAETRSRKADEKPENREAESMPMPEADGSSRYIPAELKNAVTLRDQDQCTQRGPEGLRCQGRRWLDIHHIVPLSRGGRTHLPNLTTLCRGHHQMIHKENTRETKKESFPVPGQENVRSQAPPN